jgi:hypothetical protein
MGAAVERQHMRSQRRGLLIALYGLLIVGGLLLARHLADLTELVADPRNEAYLGAVVMTAVVIYVVVAALPFVPAAEIGLGLMLMLGAEIAALVYACTVFALMLPYLVGRAVPPSACAAVFDFFGLRKLRVLVLEMSTLDANTRLEVILAPAPPRMVSKLVRHRYLALAFALNLPGNGLIGGGGGIALSAGMSGLYPMPAYLASVAVAVAPVPLFIALSALWQ